MTLLNICVVTWVINWVLTTLSCRIDSRSRARQRRRNQRTPEFLMKCWKEQTYITIFSEGTFGHTLIGVSWCLLGQGPSEPARRWSFPRVHLHCSRICHCSCLMRKRLPVTPLPPPQRGKVLSALAYCLMAWNWEKMLAFYTFWKGIGVPNSLHTYKPYFCGNKFKYNMNAKVYYSMYLAPKQQH